MKRGTARGIAYWEAGEGIPFLALHGYTLDHRMAAGAFEPLFVALGPKGHYRRIYPDLPFMGESEDLAEASGSDAMLAAMVDFVAELALSGRYPRASYHIVDGAGHNAQIEAPRLFEAAFAAWLEDCSP